LFYIPFEFKLDHHQQDMTFFFLFFFFFFCMAFQGSFQSLHGASDYQNILHFQNASHSPSAAAAHHAQQQQYYHASNIVHQQQQQQQQHQQQQQPANESNDLYEFLPEEIFQLDQPIRHYGGGSGSEVSHSADLNFSTKASLINDLQLPYPAGTTSSTTNNFLDLSSNHIPPEINNNLQHLHHEPSKSELISYECMESSKKANHHFQNYLPYATSNKHHEESSPCILQQPSHYYDYSKYNYIMNN